MLASMGGVSMLLPGATTCRTTTRSSVGLAHFCFALGLVLLAFFFFVLCANSEDGHKPVEQIRMLVIKSSGVRQVTPLHPLAHGEQSNDRMRSLDTLALDERRGLLD